MSGRHTSLLFLLAVLAAGLVYTATAGAAGRPPVRNITGAGASCGDTITTKVKLTGDLDCTSTGATAITLGPGGQLDLGGHTLTADANQVGVKSTAAGAMVSDGTITGGASRSIDFENAKGFVVTGVTVSNANTGIYILNATAPKVTGNTASGNSYGIWVQTSTTPTISGNTGSGNTTDIETYSDVKDSITSNTLAGRFKLYYGMQATVSKNTSTSGRGLYFNGGAGNTISGNTVTGSASEGIELDYETGSKVTGNTVSGSSDTNYYDYEGFGNTWDKNSSTGAHYGFYMYLDEYGPVTVTNNTADTALDTGFYFYDAFFEQYTVTGPTSTISGNKATNTANNDPAQEYSGDGFYDDYSVRATWKNNTSTGNAKFGFLFNYPSAESITGNTASNNTSSGFYLEDNYTYYAQSAFTGNKATGNDNFGFYADYATLGAGNTASGNTPYDCYLVQCTGSIGTGTSSTHR